MDNINKDLVFSLPEQDDNFKFLSELELKSYQVVLYADDMSEENITQLAAIFKAISIDLTTQVHLIMLQPQQNFRYTEMCPHSGFLFLFGVSPEAAGFTILPTLYEVITFHDMKVIFSESLNSIRTQIESKKRLWACLKTYFIG